MFHAPERAARLLGGGAALVERSAFWLAALFPAVYPPALAAGDRLPAGAVLALVGVHLALVVLGHRHGTPDRSRPRGERAT